MGSYIELKVAEISSKTRAQLQMGSKWIFPAALVNQQKLALHKEGSMAHDGLSSDILTR